MIHAFFFFREKESACGGGQAEGEKRSQADSASSMEPDTGHRA